MSSFFITTPNHHPQSPPPITAPNHRPQPPNHRPNQGAGLESGLEDTDEFFGGQDVGVQWRRGDLSLGLPPAELTRKAVTFGRVTSYVGKGEPPQCIPMNLN